MTPTVPTVCESVGAKPEPCSGDSKVGLARGARSQLPIHGMRVRPGAGVTGWFIWAGEYSEADDFFEPVHVVHLAEVCPAALPFLDLPPGWRFLTDGDCYRDVWYDDALVG